MSEAALGLVVGGIVISMMGAVFQYGEDSWNAKVLPEFQNNSWSSRYEGKVLMWVGGGMCLIGIAFGIVGIFH